MYEFALQIKTLPPASILAHNIKHVIVMTSYDNKKWLHFFAEKGPIPFKVFYIIAYYETYITASFNLRRVLGTACAQQNIYKYIFDYACGRPQ
jgi:hypothetical protein